ncbi:MAG: hypothetical protein H7235_07785 [Bdellovibrionaceae bacterium]|nr:hypothetical protein [Pseudobdellovibrionaceae bacterium]
MKMALLFGCLFVSQITFAASKITISEAKNEMKLLCMNDSAGDLCRSKIDSLGESATCVEIDLFLNSIGAQTTDSNGNVVPASDIISCEN